MGLGVRLDHVGGRHRRLGRRLVQLAQSVAPVQRDHYPVSIALDLLPTVAPSETVRLHVVCAHCGAKMTLQFADWPETLEAATKPRTAQSWVCPACMKPNSGEFPGTLGWVWKGHRAL
jgi:hypothetical protein